MGNTNSLSAEDVYTISSFTERDIRRLYARFKSMDKDGNGQLDASEILGVKEISENPLVQRVVHIFDVDGNGQVSFIEFLVGLARLAVGSNEERKLRFAFDVYDVDKNGFISNGDLFEVMKMMVGDNLTDEQLQQLVDRTIRDSDNPPAGIPWRGRDSDGMLSFQEFKDAVENIKVAEQLSVDV